jgi:hypothetical protein
MPDEIVTGTEILRRAVRARNVKMNLSRLAGEIGIATDTLEQFATGKVTLLPATLNDLAREIFAGNAVYDETIDRLRSAIKHEPKSLGIKPDTGDFVTAPESSGPLVLIDPPKPAPKGPLPGWSE